MERLVFYNNNRLLIQLAFVLSQKVARETRFLLLEGLYCFSKKHNYVPKIVFLFQGKYEVFQDE